METLLRVIVAIGAVITAVAAWQQNGPYTAVGLAIVAAGLIASQIWGTAKFFAKIAVLGGSVLAIYYVLTQGGLTIPG